MLGCRPIMPRQVALSADKLEVAVHSQNTHPRADIKVLFHLLAACSLAFPLAIIAADLDTARELLSQHKYDEAAVAVNHYLADHPGDSQARFIRGLALARTGHVDAAIAVFQQLAKDHPDLVEPRNNLGVLYAQQDKFEKARDVLEEAVQIDPRHAAAQENLGDVYVALARSAYVKAGQLEPDNAAVRTKRQRLRTLLDAPNTKDDVQAAPAKTVRQSPHAQAASAGPQAAPSASAPQNTAAEATNSAGNAPIRAAVTAWAHAWSEQNVPAYFDAYGDDFSPASGQSRSAWEHERRQRITAPSSIQVQLSNFKFKRLDDAHSRVSFTQRYRSDNYRDSVRKTLELRYEHKDWRIIRETSD